MKKYLSPLKTIRKHCLDCSCGSINEVKNCIVDTCLLRPYRFGTNPFTKKREYTEEQKEVMRKRLAKSKEQ
jgi:hypothetical protein